MNQLTIIIGLALALAASVAGNLHQWQSCAVEAVRTEGKVNTAAAEATTTATKNAREEEADKAARAALVAEAYEKGKLDAEELGKAAVADLVAEHRQLRKRWAACSAAIGVPTPIDSTGIADAEAASRAESAGRIVRAAAECEAQVVGLQDFILADRAPWLPGAPRP